MSVGGATFSTPGTLELGAGNTFDLTDVTEVGTERPYNHAWWVYTPASNISVILDTLASDYGDPDEADTLIYVFPGDGSLLSNDDAGAPEGTLLSSLTVNMEAGNEYTILVGTYDADPGSLTTYRLTATETAPPPPPPSAYRIPGRPTAPRGGGSSAFPAVISPNQVSSPTPLAVGGSGWWSLTPSIDGRLSLDALLSYTTADRVRDPDDPRVLIWIYAADGTTVLTVDGTGIDPDLGVLCNRAQVNYDFTGGTTYLIRLESASGWPAATAFLRVSDYATATDWITEDPLPIVVGPPSGMNWNVLPDADGYPAPTGYQPDVLPDPVVFNYPVTGEVVKYLNPWDLGIGFEGSARMEHYPDFTHTLPHPYELARNWIQIWLSALSGKTANSRDNFNDPATNDPWLTNEDGDSGTEPVPPAIWISTRTYDDWPIGRVTVSSALDSAPPDGHQYIEDTVRESYWQASLSKALSDGYLDGSVQIDVTVNGQAPTDSPGDGYELLWESGAPPTLVSVETRNVGRSDGDLETGYLDPWGTWRWHVSVNPLTWQGDGDYQNGAWLMNASGPDPFDPSTSAEGDVYVGRVVDGVSDYSLDPDETTLTYGQFHQVIGGGSFPIPGTEVAVIDPFYDDWTPVLDTAGVSAALVYEEPLNATQAAGGMGALWFGGMLNLRNGPPTDPGVPPDSGLNNTDIGQSILQFPGLRFLFQRDRHRWVGTPVIPSVIGLNPVTRQQSRDDGRGLSAAPRLVPAPKSARLVGGHQ